MSKRAYWQSIRGVCILAVVLIHALGGYEYVNDTGFLLLRQLLNFAVATFIFISGYFVDVQNMGTENFNYITWLKNRGERLLIPFAVWSLFYSGINIVQKVYNRETVNWIGVLCRFFVGKVATPFYYIVVLFQLAVLTPFLVKIVENKGVLEKLLWLVTPAYLVYVYVWNCTTRSSPFLYETFFPAWFGFYYLGIQVKCGMKLKGNVMFTVGMFLFSCTEALFLRHYGMNQGFYISQITVGSFLYSVAFIALILGGEKGRENFLSKIGDCSYGIFYIHMFILMLISKAINIGLNWVLYGSFRFVLTVLISYGTIKIGQRLLSNNILKQIGFI